MKLQFAKTSDFKNTASGQPISSSWPCIVAENRLMLIFQLQCHYKNMSYFYNFRVNSHLEGDTGAKGKTYHGDLAAADLRMLLQDSVGCL